MNLGVIIISMTMTTIMVLLLTPLAKKFNLLDIPNNRKVHEGAIPYIGGLCVFIGLLSSQIYLGEIGTKVSLVLISSFFILMLGFCDDIVNLKPRTKLTFEILIVFITIILTDVFIKSLGFFFGLSTPINLGYLSIPFTVISVCGLINAFNMIDGSDGLAGGLSIIAIIGIILKSLPLDEYMYFNVLIGLASALFPFLLYNIFSFCRIKIFLGDGGSLFLGFFISFILVYSSQNINSFTPTYALWCVALILFDFFSVLIIRKLGKRSLIIAGKDHIHHILRDLGLSSKMIFVSLMLFGLSFLFLGYFLENHYPELSFPVFVTFFTIYLFSKLFLDFRKKINR